MGWSAVFNQYQADRNRKKMQKKKAAGLNRDSGRLLLYVRELKLPAAFCRVWKPRMRIAGWSERTLRIQNQRASQVS